MSDNAKSNHNTLGIILIVLGVVCFLIPPIPGWLIIIAGILMISRHSKTGRWIHKRLPAFLKRRIS